MRSKRRGKAIGAAAIALALFAALGLAMPARGATERKALPSAATRPSVQSPLPVACPPGQIAYTDGTSRVTKCIPAPPCGPEQTLAAGGQCACPPGKVAVRKGSGPQQVQCVVPPPCGSGQVRDAATGECRCPPGQVAYTRGTGGPPKCVAPKSCPPGVKLDAAAGQCMCPPGTRVYWDGAGGGGCVS